MKKKAGILAVAFIMLLCMFCVWPFALVRKDTKCETGSTAYLTTNREQTANSKIEQIFIAQESVLKQIAFAVHFEGESCDVTFRLEDKEGKILKEQQIQPLLISFTFNALTKKAPSTPTSPNSFSSNITLENFFSVNNF